MRSRGLRAFFADESGAAAAEYAVILGAIAAVIAIAVYALGAKVNNLYGTVAK